MLDACHVWDFEDDPYRAQLDDGHELRKATESLFVPEMADPDRRAWFEAWSRMASLFELVIEPTRWPFRLEWCGVPYRMRIDAAASICDAWAEGSLLYRRDGFSTQRPAIMLAHLRELRGVGGVVLESVLALGGSMPPSETTD